MIERTTQEENAKSKQIICIANEPYDENLHSMPPGSMFLFQCCAFVLTEY